MNPSIKAKSVSKLDKKCALKKRKAVYSEESMRKAIQDIREGTKGIREACRCYGVPRGTVQDRLHCRVPDGPGKRGPAPLMGVEREVKLRNHIIHITKIGFPVTKQGLVNIVANLTKDMQEQNPFKYGIPGIRWIQSFLKRHPEICLTSNVIKKDRAVVTEDKIRTWCTNIREYLLGINVSEILNNSDRILIVHESVSILCPKTNMVLPPNIHENAITEDKENITSMIVCTGSGKICPPLIVVPYERPLNPLIQSIPNDWVLGGSERGWMRGDIFYEYICNDLKKWLEEIKIQKPVLLLMDSHKVSITIQLSDFCHKNGIILYSMPPRMPHMNQPADSIFMVLKQIWQGTVESFYSESDNTSNSAVMVNNFCPLLEQVLFNFDTTELIKSGFRTCGLFSFDEEIANYSKCAKEDARTRKNPSTEFVTLTSNIEQLSEPT